MKQLNYKFNVCENIKGSCPDNLIENIYTELHPNIHKSDITVILPSGGRPKHLECCINSLKESQKLTNYRINYLVVEYSSEKESLDFCKTNEVSYIWIQKSIDDKYNKCLAHNIGYCISTSKLLLFHDCDLIVNDTFFENIKQYKLNTNSVAHCIGNQHVHYIDHPTTLKYFEGLITYKDVVQNTNSYFTPDPENWIATGGSIIVGRTLFERVGGFDSHLFSGYSIEDQFFWDKVTTCVPIKLINENNVFHLFHDANRVTPEIDETHLTNFRTLTKSEKYIYFELCQIYLKSLYNKIHTNNKNI
jgi:hypothetical protein